MKKKILIVSSAFYPENSPRSFRATELTKELARQGHDVTVVTHKSPLQKDLQKEFNFQVKDLGRRRFKPVHLKGSGITLMFRRILKRALSLLLEYPNIELLWLVSNALKNKKDYDLMISIAVPYPVHWGVALAHSKKSPVSDMWVADCGDPYMGQENDTYRPPFYFKYVEKWFCRKADIITVPVEGAIAGYYPEFRKKIKVIPQGFKFQDYEHLLKRRENEENGKTFAYAGDLFQGKRDPREFLEFLTTIDKDYKFYIYTSKVDLIKPYIAKSDNKIILKKPVPRQELLKELASLDFMVNFENVGSRQVPSKIIDYIILDKPILSIKTGAFDKEVATEFLNGNYQNALTIEDPDQYRIENVAHKFLTLQ